MQIPARSGSKNTMDINELNQKLDSLVEDVNQNIGNTMVQIGSEALIYIRDRVMNSGINAEGQKYEPYSTKPMLVGCKGFKNKANCSRVFGKKKNKDLKWVTLDRTNNEGKKIRLAVLDGGYKEFRQLNDLQTGFVDFSFSGRMWANIKIKSDQSEHSNGVVRIGATTDEDNKKLEGNTRRKGDILKLSANEIESIRKSFAVNITQSIERAGLK
jgi:hypothetical protein